MQVTEKRKIQGAERTRPGFQDVRGGREIISQKAKEKGDIQHRMSQKYLGKSKGQRTSKGEMCTMSTWHSHGEKWRTESR